jgi:hypothetical protein
MADGARTLIPQCWMGGRGDSFGDKDIYSATGGDGTAGNRLA